MHVLLNTFRSTVRTHTTNNLNGAIGSDAIQSEVWKCRVNDTSATEK